MKPLSPKTQRIIALDWPIDQLPGLSQEDCSRLMDCGICSSQQLLHHVRIPTRKQALIARLQIHPQRINKWAALADLAQVPGVGCQYCGLLLHAGVASVHQLSLLSPHQLHLQLLRLQVAMMQRRDLCPSVAEVTQWIYQARRLAAP
jgi:hypothetical protein